MRVQLHKAVGVQKRIDPAAADRADNLPGWIRIMLLQKFSHSLP
ncbi:hypothetical protein SDC9_187643 [bioreactor metagenome]|uniref:Uncharacterized protein n=1 Tax=bioreactor metagenome TaxID=1076179 RepID=A0A645HM41_9ZZZZ